VTIGCNTDRANRANDAVGTSGTANDVRTADKDFVRDLAIANMAEIELGKLALERAANADVKKFAQMMIDDHTKAGEDLKAIASRHNIPVPTAIDDDHRDVREKLASRQGPDFDRAYIEDMVEGHDDVIEKLEDRIDQTKLADWKSRQAERVSGQKREERVEAHAIVAERADNPITMSINEWAAASYPIVYAHKEQAKAIEANVKRPTTN
jgi:putative membrane protein